MLSKLKSLFSHGNSDTSQDATSHDDSTRDETSRGNASSNITASETKDAPAAPPAEASQSSTEIQSPRTYAQWADLLEKLKEGDQDTEVIAAMQKGTLQWDAIAERFSARLTDALNTRMNKELKKFQTSLTRGGPQEQQIVQSLLNMRRVMSRLGQAANIPAIPEEYRKKYVALVQEQADKIQDSMENSAKSDRTGLLARIIKNNKVNSLQISPTE